LDDFIATEQARTHRDRRARWAVRGQGRTVASKRKQLTFCFNPRFAEAQAVERGNEKWKCRRALGVARWDALERTHCSLGLSVSKEQLAQRNVVRAAAGVLSRSSLKNARGT
jgi:hypothetical protein